MAKLVRPFPRRPAWLYPVGTVLTLNDGRVFKVVTENLVVWNDPTEGRGGGDWVLEDSARFWRQIGE